MARAATLQLVPKEGSVMTNQKVVLGFAGFLAVCVIGLGFAGQFQPADLHQFDYYMGLTPTASLDCGNQSASTEKPIPAIR
jgi:CHASE2 domain-containing sensor protein